MTGIQNPEPAWLRRKLPVNKCLQYLVTLCATILSLDATEEMSDITPPHLESLIYPTIENTYLALCTVH